MGEKKFFNEISEGSLVNLLISVCQWKAYHHISIQSSYGKHRRQSIISKVYYHLALLPHSDYSKN